MNWKNEAIERLSQYNAMMEATVNIPQEIRRLEDFAASLRPNDPSIIPTGKPLGPNDDLMINNIIKRDHLEKSYQNAVSWMIVTNRALNVLEPEEQMILKRMYVKPEKGVVGMLCEDLGVEQSSVYRKRDHALYRFTMALYGTA